MASGTSSSSQADSSEKVEIMKKATDLLAQGKRNMVCNEVPKAVTLFEEAVKILVDNCGELSRDCADAYYHCGSALLELGRMESTVLGAALDGVEAEDEKEDDTNEQFEKPPVDADERDKLREQVYEAMSEELRSKSEEKKDDSEAPLTNGRKEDEEVKKDEKDASEKDVKMDSDSIDEKDTETKDSEKKTDKDDSADKDKDSEVEMKDTGDKDASKDVIKPDEKVKESKDEVDKKAENEQSKDVKSDDNIEKEQSKEEKVEEEAGKELNNCEEKNSEQSENVKDDQKLGSEQTENKAEQDELEQSKKDKVEQNESETKDEVVKSGDKLKQSDVSDKDSKEEATETDGDTEEKMDEDKSESDSKLKSDKIDEVDGEVTFKENKENEEKSKTKSSQEGKAILEEKHQNTTVNGISDDVGKKAVENGVETVNEPMGKKDAENGAETVIEPMKKDVENGSETVNEPMEKKDSVNEEQEGNSEAMETDDKGEEKEEDEEMAEDENEETVEDEGAASQEDEEHKGDDVGNFQLAWEYLDLAKVIYLKSETKEDQLKAAECHVKLGEISMETETHATAAEDLESALKIQQSHLEKDDRLIAETHYTLGLAYGLGKEFESSIKHYLSAVSVIEARIAALTKFVEESEVNAENKENNEADALKKQKEEIKDLRDLVPEMKEKIEDTKIEQKDMAKMKEIAKEALGLGSSTAVGFGASSSKADDIGTSSTTITEKMDENGEKKATDISAHLIRKKRKPEEESVTEVEAKKIKEDASGDAPAEVKPEKMNGHVEMAEVSS